MKALLILAGLLIALKGIQLIYRVLQERREFEAEIYELEKETGVNLYD